MTSLLNNAFALIDNANKQDPNQDADDKGQLVAKEWLYSLRMTEILNEFCPQASEALQVAARAQHIERWKSPRSDFPDGKSGYKKWRSNLYIFHATRASELAKQAGYDHETCDRIAYLVQKRGLKRDEESQTLEDVVCLCFLKYYFDAFAAKHSDEKIISIVQKTWKKMSANGHQAALDLNYSTKLAGLLKIALS